MTDEEILTKRLSDWKPETDIKLQKAFGKFVEEAGELLEANASWRPLVGQPGRIKFEDEIADVQAFAECIHLVVFNESLIDQPYAESFTETFDVEISEGLSAFVTSHIGKALNIVGRCQIQGIDKNDPETKQPNKERLREQLVTLVQMLRYLVKECGLDQYRITKRCAMKIDSKLPWIMGTATDLLPDV